MGSRQPVPPEPPVPSIPSMPAGSPASRAGHQDGARAEPVVIDCDRCEVRGHGCGDCVVTVLLGGPPPGVALTEVERAAIHTLAGAGLVPPLRMVQPVPEIETDPDG